MCAIKSVGYTVCVVKLGDSGVLDENQWIMWCVWERIDEY